MPLLPLLVTAGYVGGAYEGARYMLKGAEEVTQIPFYTATAGLCERAVADVRDVVGGFVRPIVSGFSSEKPRTAGPSAGARHTSEPLPRRPMKTVPRQTPPPVAGSPRATSPAYSTSGSPRATSPVYTGATAIERERIREIIGLSRARSAQGKERGARLVGASDPVVANKARAHGRFATLAQSLCNWAQKHVDKSESSAQTAAAAKQKGDAATANQAEAAESQDLAIADHIASNALDAATASMNPPTDPRNILTSDAIGDDEKAAATEVIDAINRDSEPDYDALSSRMVGSDIFDMQADYEGNDLGRGVSDGSEPGMPNSTADMDPGVADVSGHDHGHDHKHVAGKSCACGGSCGPCAAKRKNKPSVSGNDGWGAMPGEGSGSSTPTVAGGDAWGQFPSDDGIFSLPAPTDLMQTSDVPGLCPSGACSASPRGRVG